MKGIGINTRWLFVLLIAHALCAMSIGIGAAATLTVDGSGGADYTSTQSADEVNITLEWHFGGCTYTCAVADNYAYVGKGQDLIVLDISNPAAPSELSKVTTASLVKDIAVSGNYAYVATERNGLVIVDISNKTTPTLAGSYNTAGSACSVAVSTNYTYIADISNGLVIVEISNKTAPTLVESFNTTEYTYDVAVLGNYAYVADYSNGLVVVDITSPTTPTLAGSYNTGGYSRGVVVVGNYAYVADGSNGLEVVDISSPTAPVLAGSYDTAGYAYGVVVAGNYAYVADMSMDFVVVYISNPAAPALAGSYDTAGSAYSVEMVGDYAYVADDLNGLIILRIDATGADFTSPVVIDTSPENLTTDVMIDSNITATFSELIDSSTLNNKTVKVYSLDNISGETFEDTVGTWNSTNFQDFIYTEQLMVWSPIIDDSHRTIGEDNITYSTQLLMRDYQLYTNEGIEVKGSGNYSVMGWLGDEYVVIVNGACDWIISRLVFEQDSLNTKTLHTGETWDLGDGYSFKLLDLDVDGNEALVALSDSSGEIDNEVCENHSACIFSTNLGTIYDAPIFVTYLNKVNLTHIELKYTWLISQDITEIQNNEELGDFIVKTFTDRIIIENDEDMLLMRGSTIPLFDDLMFEVENTPTVRYRLVGTKKTALEGDISYDSPSRTVTFNPVSNLLYDTIYISCITTGVEDLAGNGLTEDYVWTFRTIATAIITHNETIGVYDNGGTWALWNASGNTADIVGFGWPGTEPVVGDWDGDGSDEVGVFNNMGTWALWNTTTSSADIVGFGWADTQPIVGDWDGDGTDEVGVYDNAGTWALWNSTSGSADIVGFGWAGTQPVVGDWDGDGITEVGIYNTGGNNFFIHTNAGSEVIGLGWTGVTPVVGSWV